MKIKKNLGLMIGFLMLFYSIKAEESKAHVHFMLFGGFNSSKTFTQLNSSQTIFSEAQLNYNFGAGLRIEFASILFLQPEVYFTRKGGLENAFRTSPTDTFNQQVSVHSVDVPIMFGFRFFHSEGFCLRMYGGPVLSFLYDSQVDVYKNRVVMPWAEVSMKTSVFSMQYGAGLDITKRFTFDVRYEYAFSPMFKLSDFKTSYRILYFTLGLKLF